MDTLQCAVVLAKLEKFEWEIARRLEIGRLYNDTLDALGVARVQQRKDRTSVYGQYTVLSEDRDRLQQKMKEAGIPTAVHYPVPLNLQSAYAHLCCPDCTPNAASLAKRVMSLPMHPYLSAAEVAKIASVLV